MACNSCGMLLGSVMSAMMKRARWARVLHGFRQVAAGGLVEIEDDGKVVVSRSVSRNASRIAFRSGVNRPENQDDL